MGNTALLLLDLQNGILDHFGDVKAEYLHQIAMATQQARAAGLHIIYVKTAFRRGHPDISPRNAALAGVVSHGGFVEGDAAVAIASEVAPTSDAVVVVTKRRVSAFAGSDLDTVLRSLGVDHLVLAGIATSGAVLSTLRQAADLDFGLTVLADLCLDRDAEVHRVLVEKVFPKQGRTLSADEWLRELEQQQQQ